MPYIPLPGGEATIGTLFDVKMLPQPWVLVRDFNVLGLSVQSFREPLEESVRRVVIPSILIGFISGGYGEWPEHADATTERWGEHPLLTLTGKVRNAATAFARWQFTRTEAFMGNWPQHVGYGLVHQVGGGPQSHSPDAFGEIPPRPFLELQEEDIPGIEEIFLNWVDRRLIMAGFKGGT